MSPGALGDKGKPVLSRELPPDPAAVLCAPALPAWRESPITARCRGCGERAPDFTSPGCLLGARTSLGAMAGLPPVHVGMRSSGRIPSWSPCAFLQRLRVPTHSCRATRLGSVLLRNVRGIWFHVDPNFQALDSKMPDKQGLVLRIHVNQQPPPQKKVLQ